MGQRRIYGEKTMSNKIILNKRGQYYPTPSYGSVHPVLVIGIVLFVLPFLFPVANFYPAQWVKTFFNGAGLLTIIVGGALSIFKASN